MAGGPQTQEENRKASMENFSGGLFAVFGADSMPKSKFVDFFIKERV